MTEIHDQMFLECMASNLPMSSSFVRQNRWEADVAETLSVHLCKEDEDGQLIDADDLAHRAVFGAHPLGLPLAGTVENVQRFGLDDLRAWHARHHGAANVALGIAGPLDAAELLPKIERAFSGVATRTWCPRLCSM